MRTDRVRNWCDDRAMGDPARRLLELLSLLQTGRPWPAAELAERLQVTDRTVRRDVQRLRELGYRTLTRPGPGGAYRLAPGAAMPPLLLEDDEVAAVAAALQLAAEQLGGDALLRARGKLEQVLPGRLQRRAAALRRTTQAAAALVAPVDPHVLGKLAEAATAQRRVRFDYQRRSADSAGERLVDPYGQLVMGGRWYLAGWDVDRRAWRTFRIDRIDHLQVTASTYRPRALPAASVADLVRENVRGRQLRAVIDFAAPASRMRRLLARMDGELASLGAGRCRFTVWVDSYEWLSVSTATLGVAFTVVEPDEYRDYCRDLARRLARAAE